MRQPNVRKLLFAVLFLRIPSQAVAPNYGGALTAQSSMLAASSGALGLPRRGGLGAGLRQSGPMLGYRANQSQFYMSFE